MTTYYNPSLFDRIANSDIIVHGRVVGQLVKKNFHSEFEIETLKTFKGSVPDSLRVVVVKDQLERSPQQMNVMDVLPTRENFVDGQEFLLMLVPYAGSDQQSLYVPYFCSVFPAHKDQRS